MHKKIRRTLVQRMQHDVAIGNTSVEGDLLGMQANTKHQEQKSNKFPSEQAHFGGFTNAWRIRGTATIRITGGGVVQRMYMCKGCFHAHENTCNFIPMSDQEPSDWLRVTVRYNNILWSDWTCPNPGAGTEMVWQCYQTLSPTPYLPQNSGMAEMGLATRLPSSLVIGTFPAYMLCEQGSHFQVSMSIYM